MYRRAEERCNLLAYRGLYPEKGKRIMQQAYDNITFLRRFISIYFYNAEEYGSLLAGNSVPPEALKVLEVKENDLVEVALSK